MGLKRFFLNRKILKKAAQALEKLEYDPCLKHLQGLSLDNDLSVNLLTALAYCGKNELASALLAVEKALKQEPENSMALTVKGKVLRKMGQVADSLVCLQKSNEVDSENAETLYQLGQSYLELNDLDRSALYLEQLLRIHPKMGQVRMFLASEVLLKGFQKS